MTRRVLVTRTPEDCRELEELAAPHGIRIEPYPVLRFEPVEAADGWHAALDTEARARRAGRERWLLLASPRAARPLVEQAARHGGEDLLTLPVAAVGRATARSAREAGLRVELAGPGTGSGLAAELVARCAGPALFVFACGADRRRELPDALRAAGHAVTELEVYRMRRLPPAALPAPAAEIDAVVLTSPRSARYYLENLGGPLACPHFALGPTTRDAAAALGISCRIPARPEMEALVEELCTI
ncbi:MAG TPA: uroporphyrinogen-III synthase [Acidobacteria bacterium]|nr:uroporphyrinogen-III synthase [Acidobacteriota bacterium]